MDTDSLDCPNCGISLSERQLVSKSHTVESCPKCGTTVREAEGSSFTNLTAEIAGDVAAIDAWLDDYATETSHQIVKRAVPKDSGGWLWAIDTPYKFACECYYNQQHTGFVEIRMASKDQAEKALEHLADIATKMALQPYGVQCNDWDILDGSSTDTVWGVVQYAKVNVLNSPLLISITKRLNDAMQRATTGVAWWRRILTMSCCLRVRRDRAAER